MLIGYHGTTAQKAGNIIACGHFIDSVGDRHWLGDGIYFFSEELHAYIWNKNRCKNQSQSTDVHVLLEKYAILSAEIQDNRVFDLDTAEHKLMFDEAYRGACTGLKKISQMNREICAEGVVLNLMFNCMGFCNEFDLVAATFIIKINRYDKSPLQTRLKGIPQRQICIKNCDIIGKIAIDDIDKRVSDLERQALTLQSPFSWDYISEQKTRYDV